jgi:phage terminase large subunit-like protein
MYENMGEYLYGAQMLQNPTAEGMKKFRKGWLKYWNQKTVKPYMNFYIIVDPATNISISTDYTCMMVIGVDYLRNFWIMDIVRDKLELGPKWEMLRDMVVKWKPLTVGYEKNAAGASDLQYFAMKQEEEGIMFHLEPLGSFTSKIKIRIPKLMPLFEQGRIILPTTLMYKEEDMVHQFVEEEYLVFPFPKHDDMLDALSHILSAEMKITFPTTKGDVQEQEYMEDPLDMGLNSFYDDYFTGY